MQKLNGHVVAAISTRHESDCAHAQTDKDASIAHAKSYLWLFNSLHNAATGTSWACRKQTSSSIFARNSSEILRGRWCRSIAGRKSSLEAARSSSPTCRRNGNWTTSGETGIAMLVSSPPTTSRSVPSEISNTRTHTSWSVTPSECPFPSFPERSAPPTRSLQTSSRGGIYTGLQHEPPHSGPH